MAVPGPSSARAARAAAANATAMQAGFADALLTMAAGGTKAQAVLNGLGTTISTKILGPIGFVAGMSYSALRAVKTLAQGFAQFGVTGAGALEMVQNQFRAVLKGADAARERIERLRKFSDVTPFKFGDVAAGNKALEQLTRSALSGSRGMNLVGDAASVAGTNFEEMSVMVGRAYDGLASGRPIGEVLQRLQELGVVSGTTRNQIEQLGQSGGNFSDAWRVLERDLERSRGAMEYTGATLQGLQSTLEDTKERMSSGFGKGFLEAEKNATRAMTDSITKLTPVTDYYGRMLGRLVGVEEGFKNWVMTMVTSIPGLGVVLKSLGTVFTAVQVAVVGAAAALGGSWLVGLLRSTVSMKTLADATTAASTSFSAFRVMLRDLARGNFSLAASSGSAAASQAALAARTAGTRGSMSLLWKGVKLAGSALLAFVTSPIALTIAGIAALGTTLYMLLDHWNENNKAVRAYNAATGDLVGKTDRQIAGIKTLDQLTAAYTENVNALAEAYLDLAAASESGNSGKTAAAEGRVSALQGVQKKIAGVNRAGLERTQEEYDTAAAGGESARQRGYEDRSAARDRLTATDAMKDLRAEIEGAKKEEAELLDMFNKQQATRIGQASFSPGNEAGRLGFKINAGSPLDALEGRIDLTKRYEQAVIDATDAERQFAQANSNPRSQADFADRDKKMAASAKATAHRDSFSNLIQGQFPGGMPSPDQLKTMEAQAKTLRGRRNEAVVNPRSAALQREEQQKSYGGGIEAAQGVLEAQQRIAAAREGSHAAAVATLNIERAMLGTQKISADVMEARKTAIEAELALLEKRGSEERAQSQAAIEGARLNLEAVRQRREGNLTGAQSLEESAARQQDEAERGSMERKYRDQGFGNKSAGMAQREIEGRAAARGEQRGQEQREAGYARSESGGRDAAQRMLTRAMEEETRGHLDAAEALREAATRTEKAATRNQRVDEMAKREGINKSAAVKKVDAGDREEQQQRAVEIQQRKKKRDLAKEGVLNEGKARKLELSGNKEAAARLRDKQKSKEREQGLREEGFDEKQAHKIARREMLDEQQRRRQDAQQESHAAKASDILRGQKAGPLQRIAGGGGAYGLGSHAGDVLKRMDTIIKHLAAQHQSNVTNSSARMRI